MLRWISRNRSLGHLFEMMHLLSMLVAVGGIITGVESAVLQAPTPTPTTTITITPGPRPEHVDIGTPSKRQDPDALSFAGILLTAIPESLRQIAATNVPAVSSILWEEFLNDKKPGWFNDLPVEVQSYLIRKFGPQMAWPANPIESSVNEPSRPVLSTVASILPLSSGPTETLASPTATPDAAPAQGLTQTQKIGIGVGTPLAVLFAAALAIGCRFLLRRRQKASDESAPPSSPGFIPRFAFHEKSTEIRHHRAPLNPHVFHSSQDAQPTMAPALYHTHSSNRARGKRTSYTGLKSVAEQSEPADLTWTGSRGLVPVPINMQIKRKPVPASPPRLTMLDGMSRWGMGNHSDVTSPVSPSSHTMPENPFGNEYACSEDYGPKYQSGYVDMDDGLYGGHTSLSRYPTPRRNSRSDWPLRNTLGRCHKRNKSPLWDRVYEG